MPTVEKSSNTVPVTPLGSVIEDISSLVGTRNLLTPPPGKEEASETASRIAHILSLLRKLRNGQQLHLSPWTVIPFAVSELSDLRRRIDDQGLGRFFGDKVRYDFDPIRQKLILRMPTSVHDTFKLGVEHHILSELRTLAARADDVGRFASRLIGKSSSRIIFSRSTDTGAITGIHDERQPDAAFTHERNKYPGVVIEVSYTQKRKDLRKLARDYIFKSDGSIRMVVGLDIEHGGSSKRATLSVWRPEFSTDEDGQLVFSIAQPVKDKEFRSSDGSLNLSATLRLHLRDFTTTPIFEDSGSPDAIVALTSADMFDYLETAERSEAAEEHGEVEPMPSGTLKRGWASSSPEQLNSEDEAAFEADEERAAQRIQLDDSSYHESSD